MGLSDQSGNEIDEFVTDTLRNHLLGLPLDLPAINMTRARSEGIPPLNEVRRQIFANTNDGRCSRTATGSTSGIGLKHPESLVNFVAAYGPHPSISRRHRRPARAPSATRARRTSSHPGDRPIRRSTDADDFLRRLRRLRVRTGAWANADGTRPASTRSTSGSAAWPSDTNLFGGLLGSTFNYVFEKQLTDLQNGDRLYYLARTPGMNLRTQLEGNSFAELVMRNTDAHTPEGRPVRDGRLQVRARQPAWPAATGSGITSAARSATTRRPTATRTPCSAHMPNGQFRYRAINTMTRPASTASGLQRHRRRRPHPRRQRQRHLLGNEGNDIIEGGGGSTSHSAAKATTSSPTSPATTCPRAVPATTPSTPGPASTSSWPAPATTSPTVEPTSTRRLPEPATTS